MKSKTVAVYGMCVALAMILSYVEALIPLSIAVPGVKIGLANIAVLFALYKLGGRAAFVISLLRVFLVSVLFGNAMTLIYSIAGAFLSLVVMLLMKKSGAFGTLGVSIAGGVAHNVGQIAVAAIVLETVGLMYYLPPLLVSGTVAGVAIGAVSAILIKRIDIKKS